MAKILVKKSTPKGVLIKKRVGQQLPNDQGLFQTPDRGKSLMDFARIAFGPRRKKATSEFGADKPGIKPTARLAAFAGMGGKAIAGLGALNETMNAMQGGNISAPLGIGYSYERLDPTGRMISDFADPTLSHKPVKLDNTPPKKASVDAFLDPRNSHTRGPTGPPIRLPPSTSYPEGELISQDDPRNQPSTKPMNYDNTPYTQMLEAGKGMSQRQANNILTHGQPPFQPFVPDRPSPVKVPIEAVSNVTGPMHSTATPPGGIMNNPSPPLQASQQLQTKTLADHNAALTGASAAPPIQPMPQPPQPVQPTNQGHAPQPTAPQTAASTAPPPSATPTGQPTLFNPAFQQPTETANVPSTLSAQEEYMKNLMGDPDAVNRSFVTALTEKLGADVVYKMSPHEIGTFAAYTLLKLR